MKAGHVIQARVSRITRFGIVLEVEGWTGLVHISEAADRPIRHPSEVAKVGDIITVKVIRVFSEAHQFGATRRGLNLDDSANMI